MTRTENETRATITWTPDGPVEVSPFATNDMPIAAWDTEADWDDEDAWATIEAEAIDHGIELVTCIDEASGDDADGWYAGTWIIRPVEAPTAVAGAYDRHGNLLDPGFSAIPVGSTLTAYDAAVNMDAEDYVEVRVFASMADAVSGAAPLSVDTWEPARGTAEKVES